MSKSFVKNGIYNTVAGGIRILLGVLTIPLLVSNLGIQEYGIWTLVSSLVGMLSLLEGGFSTTTTFFISQDVSNEDREGLSQTLTVTIISILGLASLGGVSLWLSAELITTGFYKLDLDQHLTIANALRISSLVLWFRLLQQILVALIQGLQEYRKTSTINTLQSITQYTGYITIAYLGGRTVELMAWQLIVTVLFLIVYIVFVLKAFHPWSIHYAWNNQKSFSVLKYSISVWVSNLGGVLFSQVDKILVGYIANSTVLGIYGVITNICSQINVISAAPVQPILPLLTEYLARNDYVEVKLQLKKAFQMNCFIAILLGSFLMFTGDMLLPMMLKSSIDKNILLSYQVGVLIYTFYSLNAVGYYACFAISLAKYCMTIVIISGISSLIFIKFGLENWGLVGAVMGNGGYLFSLLLGWKSMGKMNITPSQWLSWITIPIISFLCLSIFTLKFPDHVLIQKIGQLIFLIPIIIWSKEFISFRKIRS
jgi:O-antigen/teichoic acid export membrane protein